MPIFFVYFSVKNELKIINANTKIQIFSAIALKNWFELFLWSFRMDV